MNVSRYIALAGIALWSIAGAQSQSSSGEHSTHHPSASASSPAAMADGEVRKIDKEQGKLTLRHGPLKNLEMPPMTMVFKVADPKMLDAVKEGDKVRFSADRVNGAITVTAIERAK